MAGTEATIENNLSGNSTPSTSTATSPDSSNNRIIVALKDCPSEDLNTPASEGPKDTILATNNLSNTWRNSRSSNELCVSKELPALQTEKSSENGLSDSITVPDHESHNPELPNIKSLEEKASLSSKLSNSERQVTETISDDQPADASNPSPSASLNADPSESQVACGLLDIDADLIEERVEETTEDSTNEIDTKLGDAGPSQGLTLGGANINCFASEGVGDISDTRSDSNVNNWQEEDGSMGGDFEVCSSRCDPWSFSELESWSCQGTVRDDIEDPYELELKKTIDNDLEGKVGSEDGDDEVDEEDNEDEDGDSRDLEIGATVNMGKPGTSANNRKTHSSRGRKRKSENRGEGDILGGIPYKKQFPEDKTASTSLNVGGENLPSSSTTEKVKRSLIPTKDNPPPEMKDWLTRFERWTNAERLLAIDRLIETCEPMQVRHMMQVIEPQFQRDFISLLPKELALYVLSFLEPRDLLRAAQTCRNWRFLAEDNLLWREKCRAEDIKTLPDSFARRRGRPGMSHISPWKAEYMRQHAIEMNWRTKPLPTPKELKGHDDHVITCLQFSGNRIVSGSDDNTLKVWSLVTGKCMRTLAGHTGGVWSSQMSDNIIISGSTDRTLKVWNADTGECIHTLYGHTSTVRCMHLHGRKVVSGSRDATLRVWDIEEGQCLHMLVGHMAAVRCVQYDGKLVVSGAYDYMVKVWNPEREECLHTLQGHTNRVYSLQFDGVHVVSGSLDTSIRVWEVETGTCRHTLMGHQSLTSGMELRNNILVSGNADSTVKVWDIVSGQCLQTLSGPNKHQSAVTCLQFNSRFVITSSDDGTVKLWDVKTGEFVRNLVALDSGGSGGVVWRIRASETKLVCAVGSRNGTEETKLLVLDFDVDPRS